VTTKRRFTMAAALIALGCAWLITPPVRAMSLQPLNLADLVRQSNQIVRGTVAAVNAGVDGQLPYTEIKVNVAETIRGTAGKTLTFRQFGLQAPRPAADGRQYVGLVAGMPRYAAGDQVLLFLGPVSRIGYRTTVGLGQGHFSLRGGNLENDASNAGLFRNVNVGRAALSDKEQSMIATTQGAVGADAFLGLVRRAVSESWWNPPTTPISKPIAPKQRPAPRQLTKDGGLTR
jgi:hypothetical protein